MSHVVRPLTQEARTRLAASRHEDRIRSRFDTPWSTTLWQLDHELAELGADRFVLQLDVTEGDIRIDGMIRATARPASDDVAIAFDSADGPLLFACGRFDNWRDNVRAIALGLEALRKVDRYGITQSAEQYTGFRALPPSSGFSTKEAAAEFLIEHGSAHGAQWTTRQVTDEPLTREALYRQAAKKLHSDTGGSDEMFMRLQDARKAVAS